MQELTVKLSERPATMSATLPSAPIDLVKALERENSRLKLENSNMYFLKAENDRLAQRVTQICEERCEPGLVRACTLPECGERC